MLGGGHYVVHAATEVVRLLLHVHHEGALPLKNLLLEFLFDFFSLLFNFLGPLLDCIPMDPGRHSGMKSAFEQRVGRGPVITHL